MKFLGSTILHLLLHYCIYRRLNIVCLIYKHLQVQSLRLHIKVKSIHFWVQVYGFAFAGFLVHIPSIKDTTHYLIIAFMLLLLVYVAEIFFQSYPNQWKLLKSAMIAIYYEYNNIFLLVFLLKFRIFSKCNFLMIVCVYKFKLLLFKV